MLFYSSFLCYLLICVFVWGWILVQFFLFVFGAGCVFREAPKRFEPLGTWHPLSLPRKDIANAARRQAKSPPGNRPTWSLFFCPQVKREVMTPKFGAMTLIFANGDSRTLEHWEAPQTSNAAQRLGDLGTRFEPGMPESFSRPGSPVAFSLFFHPLCPKNISQQ